MMAFFSTADLRKQWLGNSAFGISALCLFFVVVACFTDLNHPPGVRFARLFALVIVLVTGALEYYRPWRGIILSVFLWTHWFLLRELLTRINSLFDYLPNFQGGTMAAALGCAFWLRVQQTKTAELSTNSETARRENQWTFCFLAIFLSACVSTIYFYIRYFLNMNENWTTQSFSWRTLLSVSPLNSASPAMGLVELVPTLSLGIIILESLKCGRLALPFRLFIISMFSCGCIIAVEAAIQIYLGPDDWHWSFDKGPPGGPFYTRTILAPVLICFSVLGFASAFSFLNQRAGRVMLIGSTLMSFVAILTTTRNALFGVLCMLWLSILWKPGKFRVACALLIPAIFVLVILYSPMPTPSANQPAIIQRLLGTVESVRTQNWSRAFSLRGIIYKSSSQIWLAHPILGSGLNTMYMQVQPGGPFDRAAIELGEPQVHSHNTPLHFLCEMGPLAFLGWIVAFLVLPAIQMRSNSKSRYFFWALLTIGLLHQLDHIWVLWGLPSLLALLPAIGLSLQDTPLVEP